MTAWTPERDDKLRVLWADPTLTCTDVAERLRVSKNSAVGRAARLHFGPKAGKRAFRTALAREPAPALCEHPMRAAAGHAPLRAGHEISCAAIGLAPFRAVTACGVSR